MQHQMDEINQIVGKTWSKIEKDLSSNTLENGKVVAENGQGGDHILRPDQLWTTVSLFISSTFRDMNAEREYIVKNVLPDLVDWAEKRGIRIVETDLRWGVPKESTNIETIQACLGELEFIKKNCQGQPLFLCLLGGRYGWIPTVSEIPPELAEHYNWVDNVSITHMEILQGAIRCRNRNALFCLRCPEFNQGLSPQHADIFLDKGELEIKQLDILKTKIGAFLPEPNDQLYTYDTTLKKESEDPKKPELEFKAEFAEKILNFFRTAVERMFPGRSEFTPPDEVEKETFNQWKYQERTVEATHGLEAWTQELASYLISLLSKKAVRTSSLKHFKTESLIRGKVAEVQNHMKEQEVAWPSVAKGKKTDWNSRPLCILSEPGQGKTSLTSHVVKRIMTEEKATHVFFHYCGMTVSEGSSNYATFLKRLIQFLLKVLGINKKVKEFVDESFLYQTKSVHDLLTKLSAKNCSDKKVLIFIDSPETFPEVGSTVQLQWDNFLPVRFPSNCVVVLTATTNPDSWIHDYLSLADAPMLRMPEANAELRSIIVKKFFDAYTKKLDPEQLSILINKEGAHLPLWLILACEELRVFGNFRQVTSKIQEFETTLQGLLKQILNRLIKEFPNIPVAKLLRYISIAPQPLAEQDLPKLLRNSDSDEVISPLDLAKLRLVLKPYIVFSGGEQPLLLPFHMSLVQAANRVCTATITDEMAAKQELAFYLVNHADGNTKYRWSYNVGILLWEADCREELLRFYQYDQYGRDSVYKWDTIAKYRCPFPVVISGVSTGGVVQFRICQPCSTRIDFELNGHFTDFCWICKNRLFPNDPQSKPAAACPSHPEYPIGIGEQTCRICGTFRPPSSPQWAQLKLCQRCGQLNTCCHVSVQQSTFRYPLFSNTA